MPRLLVVHHTSSPALRAMLEAVVAGARDPELADAGIDVVVSPALAATVPDVLAADAFVLGTPANIGYMSGALKHFFDQIYYPCLDAKSGAPYGLYVHGASDTTGAVRAVKSIASGLGWAEVVSPVVALGPVGKDVERECYELGATVAANLAGLSRVIAGLSRAIPPATARPVSASTDSIAFVPDRGALLRSPRPHHMDGEIQMHGTRLAVLTMSAIAVGVLAGCGNSGNSASGGATQSAPAAGSASSSAPTASSAATATPAVAFQPIVEPFDPGHPARAVSTPPSCGSQTSTVAIETCYEDKAETYDAQIDLVQQNRYQSGSLATQTAIGDDDTAWLQARQTVCAKAYQTGGTIDGINIAACLLDESTARLLGLRGTIPPEAALKSTDSTSLTDVAWYTTPEGSRIGMTDTQGDMTGGAVIAWVIIGGWQGFVVNPAQFYYSDGAFTDKGVLQAPGIASGYRVAPGAEYQFSVDYSHLSSDPNGTKGTGGYVYAPGNPVAVWR